MAVLTDLLTLRKELLSSVEGHEKSQKEAAYRAQIVTEISGFFDNPKYPKRRRSLGAIRKRLGVFEADDPELKDILFSMGARVHRGEGEDALWELPLRDGPGAAILPPSRTGFPRVGLWLIVVAVVLLGLNGVLIALFDLSLLSLFAGASP